jgi:hypothetical protein
MGHVSQIDLGCRHIHSGATASSARRLRPRIGDEPTSVLAFTSRVSTLFALSTAIALA